MIFDPDKTIKTAINKFTNYCDGYAPDRAQESSYILGVVLEATKTKILLNKKKSSMVDKINAFDKSETTGTYIGQINMITVSSFCGLQGIIWGLDVAKSKYIRKIQLPCRNDIKVYEIDPLLEASRKLIGTVHKKRFQLIPGAHVPCAGKNISVDGPSYVYSAIGIGIPEDRNKEACLLMENIGETGKIINDGDKIKLLHQKLSNEIVKSIEQIGENNNIKYKEVFVGVKGINIKKGEVGNALVAAPYITIPKNAIPKGKKMSKISLEDWENKVKKYFIYNMKK